MKFRFIGNGKDDPETITVFDVLFRAGEAVEVTAESVVNKLKNNGHFEAVAEAVKKRRGRPRKVNVSNESGSSDESTPTPAGS